MIPKALQGEPKRMLQERHMQNLLEACYAPYRNAYFLAKKKNKGYRLINAAVDMTHNYSYATLFLQLKWHQIKRLESSRPF